MSAVFGPAGRPDSFEAMGYKKTEQLPDYLQTFGLTAFEYQFGRGVRYTESVVAAFGEKAKAAGIRLSIHSPYYISLSSAEEEKRENSIQYLVDCAKAARLMGADRIVVHTGSCGKMSREEGMALAAQTLRRAVERLDELGYSDITLCPETMGKVNHAGTDGKGAGPRPGFPVPFPLFQNRIHRKRRGKTPFNFCRHSLRPGF